ncbi:sensor histidine kinase, partial [Streptomyces daliensis]|nr:sensor histidine kinase [Streptomyces daliensis]
GLWKAVRDSYWYAFIPVTGFFSAVLCACLGTALLAVALRVNVPLIKAHFLLVKLMISPSRGAELAQRVERLYETRHDAADESTASCRVS